MKRKVCHLSYNHDPFDDRIYWKEALTLVEAGYDVTHICVGNVELDFITDEGVRIIQVQQAISTKNIWLRRGLYFFFRKNKTIDILLQKAKLLHADIYHYHDLQLNAFVNDLKKFFPDVRIIYDCHEAYHLLLMLDVKSRLKAFIKQYIVTLIKKWELNAAKKCNHIITNYNYVQEYFSTKVSQVPVTNIHNYNLFDYAIQEKPDYRKKCYDFIYSGHIAKNRGINEIIHAFSIFIKEKTDSKLLLIGPFAQEDYYIEVKDLIRKLALDNSVIIHPPVPFVEIKYYYQKSRIGLCTLHKTSIFEHALPVKLFEYMSFGLPVIFSDHGLSVEIIKKSNCGILVNEKDQSAIAKAMRTLIFDRDLYNLYSMNAIQNVKNNYNWHIEKIKLLNVYSDLYS